MGAFSLFLLFMKPFIRTSLFVVTAVAFGVFMASCSQDKASTVKDYNNSIVQIQKEMFTKAQEISKVFDGNDVNIERVLQTLEGIQSEINRSHERFQSMAVPVGGERLAEAMERFFTVESHGIQEVILGVQYLQGKESDPGARKVFTDAFAQFGSQENTALRDFYSTQQQVAGQFGEKVVDVQN